MIRRFLDGERRPARRFFQFRERAGAGPETSSRPRRTGRARQRLEEMRLGPHARGAAADNHRDRAVRRSNEEPSMSLRVNTNVSALNAQRNLSIISARLAANFARLSSGSRIASPSDDPAGLGVSERMRGQIRSLSAAMRNAQDGLSITQTAEGTLQEVHNALNRMRELAVQAANGTLSAADRGTLDEEFQSLIAEIDRVANAATFNGVDLLNGTTATLDIQAGIDAGDVITVNLVDVRAVTLGIDLEDVTTAANASAAIAVIDTALDTVTSGRGELGAMQSRLQSTITSILNLRENLSAAESRIRDVDIASETTDLTRNSILQQAAVSVLAQANVQPQLALTLLS
jgi:flagellin